VELVLHCATEEMWNLRARFGWLGWQAACRVDAIICWGGK
jgi:hypothetical protein